MHIVIGAAYVAYRFIYLNFLAQFFSSPPFMVPLFREMNVHFWTRFFQRSYRLLRFRLFKPIGSRQGYFTFFELIFPWLLVVNKPVVVKTILYTGGPLLPAYKPLMAQLNKELPYVPAVIK